MGRCGCLDQLVKVSDRTNLGDAESFDRKEADDDEDCEGMEVVRQETVCVS